MEGSYKSIELKGSNPTDMSKIQPMNGTPDKYTKKETNLDLGEENDSNDSDADEKKEENKPANKPANMVGVMEVFRFAEFRDRVLIVIGMIAAAIQGAALPFMMILFGEMTNLFIYDARYAAFVEKYWLNISDHLGANYTKEEVIQDPTIIMKELEECVTMNISASEQCAEYLADMTANVYDDFFEQMTVYATYYAILGTVVISVAYIQTVCFQISSLRQCQRIRTDLFRSILRQEIGWFDIHDSGELNTRLSDDVNKIYEGIGDKIGQVFQYLAAFLAGFIVGFIYGWQLTLVILSVSPLLAASGGFMGKLGAAFTAKELKAYAKAGSIAEEVLGSIRTVTAFGGQEKESYRYDNNLTDAKSFGIKKGLTNGVSMGLIFLIIFCVYALAFWYGVELFLTKDYTPGDILIVFFSVMVGAFSLGSAGPNLQTFATARGAAYTVYQLIDLVPTIDSDDPNGQQPPDLSGNIKFSNVSFKYPSRPDIPVLTSLDLEVNVGQTVALVGPSGCGKSTVVQLLQRFYDPLEGQVCVDGVDVRDFNLKWLRRHIGVVSQEPVLFDTTIEENIRYGRDDVTRDEIERAAKMANAFDFISKLPRQYDTLVGERGAQLSGGQKQRIAIARALVRNPKILLLDEATSALDTESEAIVQSALDKAREGRTTIIIAHRLSTVRTANVIAGFDGGKIVEKGTHSELMQKGGIYYALVTNQTKSGLLPDDVAHSPVKDVTVKELFRLTSVRSDTSDQERRRKRLESVMSNAEETPPPEVPMKRIFKLNSPEWQFITLGCIGAIVSGAIQPAFAIIFSEILGVFAETNPEEIRDQTSLYCLLFVAIGVAAGGAMFLQSYGFAKSGEELTLRLRQLSFKAYLRQDITYYDNHKNSTGALCTRLATDASTVQGATGARLGVALQSLASIGTGLAIGFIYSWALTLLIVAFAPFFLLSGFLEMQVFTNRNKGDKEYLEASGKIAIQCVENMRTVATLTKEDHFYHEYYKLMDIPTQKDIGRAHFRSGLYGFSQGVIFFAYAACFTFGAYLVEEKGLYYEDMFKVITAIAFSAIAIGQANSFAPDYAKAKESAAKIFELLDREPEIDNFNEFGDRLSSVSGKVAHQDVHFAYPTRPNIPVLQGVSVVAEPGKRLALVGSSGCGKSTIVQLTERFYDPARGRVALDGHGLKDLHIQWLRSQMGIVSQEPILFDCSIRDNIAYGDNSRQVPMDAIIAAAKQANIHTFIESLPNGYDTMAGDKGTQLSGGQKQRIAIARALVRNPKILLLDEATSALDTESEKIVQEALDKAQDGRTCLVIAHRLSTIQNADCIIVIDNGQIVEKGTHNELIALKGFYYRLNNAQLQHAKH